MAQIYIEQFLIKFDLQDLDPPDHTISCGMHTKFYTPACSQIIIFTGNPWVSLWWLMFRDNPRKYYILCFFIFYFIFIFSAVIIVPYNVRLRIPHWRRLVCCKFLPWNRTSCRRFNDVSRTWFLTFSVFKLHLSLVMVSFLCRPTSRTVSCEYHVTLAIDANARKGSLFFANHWISFDVPAMVLESVGDCDYGK